MILEFQDDLPTVFYLFNVVNNARTPVDTGKPLVLDLPRRRRGRRRWSPGPATMARMRGPPAHPDRAVPAGPDRLPGGLPAADRRRRFASSRRWPAAVEGLLVAAEKVGGLTLSSPQLTATPRGRVERPDLRHGHRRPARPRASRSRWSSRACRRRRPGRAMSRSAWPALLALLGGVGGLAAERPTRTRARDALVGRARAAAWRHRRHRRRAAGARRRRPAGLGQARAPGRRCRAGLRGARPAARRSGVTADFDRVAAIGVGRHYGRRRALADISFDGRAGRDRRPARPERRREVHAPGHPGDAAGRRRRDASTTARDDGAGDGAAVRVAHRHARPRPVPLPGADARART